MKLRVFRVQPSSFEKLLARAASERNRSAVIRETILQACKAPPTLFPRRRVKADLKPFSVFMDDAAHQALVEACRHAGVSKNLFVEAAFERLGSMARST